MTQDKKSQNSQDKKSQDKKSQSIFFTLADKKSQLIFLLNMYIFFYNSASACPQVFSSGGTCTLYLHFWGYIKIFGGAMYPLTLHLGVQKNELHFLHARLCILYSSCHRHWIVSLVQSWRKLFFLSDIGSDRNWGFVCLCVCPTIFL